MKRNAESNHLLPAWGNFILVGLIFLLLTPYTASAAPDQERLNRPSHPQLVRPQRDARNHDFKAERERTREQRADTAPPRSNATPACPSSDSMNKTKPAASAFSDRAFLSASLARTEMALEMALDVLHSPTKGSSQIENWAKQVLSSTKDTIPELEKVLQSEGGIDRKAYIDARQTLELRETNPLENSAPARFILFLFPYCEQTMEAAIPALLRSPQEEVANVASDLLIAQAKLGLEIRRWLHTHHYRNDI